MGTTLNKLEYVNTTKEQMKTALNQFGAGITDETTFREYAEKINDIYDNWEKVTGEGTDLSLSPTLKGKLDYDSGKVGFGDTYQEGTPTPDSPQNIEVVTGEQEVVVENKNLFNYSTDFYGSVSLSNYITNNNDGTFTTTGLGGLITAITKTLSAGTYTISIQACEGYSLGSMYIRNTGGNNSTPTYTFTLAEETEMTFDIRAYTDITKFYIQLEQGSTATTYIAHQEQNYTISLGNIELCKIGDYQDYIYKNNGKWYKHEVIGKYAFTGSEYWEEYTNTAQGLYKAYSTSVKLGRTNDFESRGYCNHLKILTSYSGGTTTIGYGTTKNATYLSLLTSTANSVQQVKDWITSVKPVMYYILATATDIEITDTSLINQLEAIYNAKSYNGTTYITSSGSLPMILKIRALKKGGN